MTSLSFTPTLRSPAQESFVKRVDTDARPGPSPSPSSPPRSPRPRPPWGGRCGGPARRATSSRSTAPGPAGGSSRVGEEHACVSAGPSAGLRVELSARTSGSHVRFVSTGTHSWSRTNRTDKFFPIGCPLVRTRRFSWRSGNSRTGGPLSQRGPSTTTCFGTCRLATALRSARPHVLALRGR
jgi:hypothetical protein